MARLILHGGEEPQFFTLNGVATIGRQSSNTVQIAEPKASRSHARVLASGSEFVVEDMESSNGTKVNGRKVTRCTLRHGDTIQIGNTRLVFENDEAAAAAPAPKQESASDPLMGTTLGGYEILSRLGQGGMGTVYRARQLSMEREVALKVMKKDLGQNRDFVKGFMQEARVAGQLTHPAIVQVHDFGEAEGILYFSMEYVDGETVHAMLKRDGKIPVLKSLDIALGVCEALAHATQHKVVHQDVKPHNIMVDKRGNIKLADLGLATIGGREKPAARKSNVIMGTPHYMAPEQSQKGEIDSRTDLYALGATMFHMLTGRVPFDGPNSLVILTKHITQERPDPRQYDVTIPAELAEYIMKMMSVEMGKRPADPKETSAALKAIKQICLKEQEAQEKRKGKEGGVIRKKASLSTSGSSERVSVTRDEREAREEPRTTRQKPVSELVSLGVLALILLVILVVVLQGVGSLKNSPASSTAKAPPPAPRDDPVAVVKGPEALPWRIKDPPVPPSPSPTPAATSHPADTEALKELQKVLDARDRALQSGNFTGALGALDAFLAAHPTGDAAGKARQERLETTRIVAEAVAMLMQGAEQAAGQKNYRTAAAKATRLISADPRSAAAARARELMDRIDREAEPVYGKAMADAEKALESGRLAEVMKVLGDGLDRVGGTKWADPLTARQLQVVLANRFLQDCERARQQRATLGKPTDVTVPDPGGKKDSGVLREIAGLSVKVETKGATREVPIARIAPSDIYDLLDALERSKDHVGLANLWVVLKKDDLAQKELEKALKLPELAEEAARLQARLSGVTSLKLYDFSKWQHQGDWDAPLGAWATKDDRYVLESPEGGETTLKPDAIGGPFPARNARISCEVIPGQHNEGYYIAVEYGTENRNVTVLLNAEGYTLQAELGERAQAKGAWKPGATKLELAFKDTTVTVYVNGQKGESLTLPAIQGLAGTVSFRVREAACAFDNVMLRTVQ